MPLAPRCGSGTGLAAFRRMSDTSMNLQPPFPVQPLAELPISGSALARRKPRSVARGLVTVALVVLMVPVAAILAVIGIAIAATFGVPFSSNTVPGEVRLPDITT